jgi:hypothetical protein
LYPQNSREGLWYGAIKRLDVASMGLLRCRSEFDSAMLRSEADQHIRYFEEREMQSTLSTIIMLIGVVLMAGFGSSIARQIGVEQWQMAGFAIGLLLCATAYTWELRSRLKKVEDAIEKMKVGGNRLS